MSKVVVNFSLDAETAEMLDKMSKERKIPKSVIIREMLKRENTADTIDKIELEKRVDTLTDCLCNPQAILEHPYTMFVIYKLTLMLDIDICNVFCENKERMRQSTIKTAHDYWSNTEPDDPLLPKDIDAFGDQAFEMIMKCIKTNKKLLDETSKE